MSSARASAKQAAEILVLVNETDWNRDEVQHRLIEHFGLLRVIAEALGDGKLSEEEVRAMHPLFYEKGELAEFGLPAEMTIGGRTYEILGFLKGDEKYVDGRLVIERAKEMQTHLGKDDCEHILAHQNEIPAALRGEVIFIFLGFLDLQNSFDDQRVAGLYWLNGRWFQSWDWLDRGLDGRYRVLRRK